MCCTNLVISMPPCRVSSQSAIPTLSYRTGASHGCTTLVFTSVLRSGKRGKQTSSWCSPEHEGPSLSKWWARRGWKEQCEGVCKLDVRSAVPRPVASAGLPQATCVGRALNGAVASSTPCFSCVALANAQWLHKISYIIITPQTLQKLCWWLPGTPASCLHLSPQSASFVTSTELNVADPGEAIA